MIIDNNNEFFVEGEDFDREDHDSFLQGVSIELMEDGIEKQFEDPTSDDRKHNYIEAFYRNYAYTKARIEDNDDQLTLSDMELSELEDYKDKFLGHVLNCYYDYLSIGIPDFSNISSEDQKEILDMLYRFFFKRMKKNFVSVVKKFIDDNPNIGDQFEDRTDVTTKSYENIFSPEDIKIISNLDEIINLALDKDYTVDEFLDACMYEDSNTAGMFVKEAFLDNRLTGNFVTCYIGYVSELTPDIISKLRQYIFRKYPDGADTDVSTDLDTDLID